MKTGFELLEEKVRRTAEIVRDLRRQKAELEAERNQLQARLEQSEGARAEITRQRGASADDSRKVERLSREVEALRDEREEVRRRIGQMVEILEGLE